MLNPDHQPSHHELSDQERVTLEQLIKTLVNFIGSLDYRVRLPLVTITSFVLLIALLTAWERSMPYDPSQESEVRLRPEETMVPFENHFPDISGEIFHSVETGQIKASWQDLETGVEITIYLDAPFEGDQYFQWGPYLDIYNTASHEGRVYTFDRLTQDFNLVVSYDGHYSTPETNGYENPYNVLAINPFLYKFSDEQIEDASPRFFMMINGQPTEFAVPSQTLLVQNPDDSFPYLQSENRNRGQQILYINSETLELEIVSPSFTNAWLAGQILVNNSRETAYYFIPEDQRSHLIRYDLKQQTSQVIELGEIARNFNRTETSYEYLNSHDEVIYRISLAD